MPAPAFAVVRTGEQLVDDPRERLRLRARRILQERVHLFRRRGQPDQIEVRPPNQLLPGRRRIRPDPGCFHLRQDKVVNRSAAPRTVLHRRQLALLERLERPPFLRARRQRPIRPRFAFQFRGDQRIVVRRAQVDPFGDAGDGRVGQLVGAGRHVRLLGVLNQLDQRTFLGLARHDRHADLPPFEEPFAVAQIEIGFDLLAAMASADTSLRSTA